MQNPLNSPFKKFYTGLRMLAYRLTKVKQKPFSFQAPSISSIKVGNVEVKLSYSLKCLGVTVDKHLDMDKQVKTVAKNCFYYLRILHSLRNFV